MPIEAWLASGRLVDLVLAGMLLEGVGLLLYRRMTGRGIDAADLITNLAAGAALSLALRGALVGPLASVPVFLVCALIAHVANLRERWRR